MKLVEDAFLQLTLPDVQPCLFEIVKVIFSPEIFRSPASRHVLLRAPLVEKPGVYDCVLILFHGFSDVVQEVPFDLVEFLFY